MRRPVRFVVCISVLSIAGATLAAGSAIAAAATPEPHGLGALRPAARIAPHVQALTVPPASVDLRQWAVTPGDQGAVSSCVTWAIDYSMLGWYSRFAGVAGQPFAPMYTYSQINFGADNGSYPTAALDIAVQQGSDTRADYTQGDYDWRDQPTNAERANAAHYKIKGYETLFSGVGQAGTAAGIKNALATNHPVAIEMAVRNGFESLGSNPAAVDDDITSGILGYHEVLALGYDAAGLIIENSWGTGWANGGFGRISWRVVQTDVWEGDTIDGLATPPPPTPPRVSTPTVTVLKTTGKGASATVTYTVRWKGTPGASGPINHYDAWSRYGARSNVPVKLTSWTATSFTFTARVGHRYRFGARARSGGSLGVVKYTATFVAAPARPGATVHS
jgi:hypothetical protein